MAAVTEQVDISPELTDIRHWLHAHPEISYAEYKTSSFIAGKLMNHGIEILDNPLDTGVVAQIKGTAHIGPKPCVALRADIDALPVKEDTGLEWSSLNDGAMHACGHDLHMTALLGAAFWLADHRDLFSGTIKLLFQPAEERDAGAKAMIKAGLLDDVDAIIGIHNNPNYAPGQIAVGPEPMMAGCVIFHVTLHAQGTHAAYPHKGTGPIEALAATILNLQTIITRNIDALHPIVLSVTGVTGGDAWNVVPTEAGFTGTVRYFYKEDALKAEERFRAIVEHTAQAYGIDVDVDWNDCQDPVVSDAGLARAVAADVHEYAELAPIHPSMASEDFCDYEPVTRALFAFVGSRGDEGHPDWHSPKFYGFDTAIPTAVRFYANAALRVLGELS